MFYISLSNKIIGICSLHNSTKTFLKEYLTDSQESDFFVEVKQNDILYERDKYLREAELEEQRQDTIRQIINNLRNKYPELYRGR